MTSAVNWFEISTQNLERAQRFYESILLCKLRPEAMGPSQGAVFPYEPASGVGGALMCGPTAGPTGAGGTLVYLNAGASLQATLDRVAPAGGQVALGSQALPDGMGFFAHIIDLDGNRIGLHAMAG